MRLFVAVHPPDEVLDAVDRIPRPDAPGLRWTRRGQWHVTLRFLGEVDDPAPVAAALQAVEVAPGTEAVLGPATQRLGNRVLMVPVAGLDALATQVRAATATFGEPIDPRPFRGHLTLARSRGRARLPGAQPVTARWAVTSFALVRSRLGSSGADHEVIVRFGVPGVGGT